MPINAQPASTPTPTYLDIIAYNFENRPPATPDADVAGTVTARVLDQDAREFERPSGDLTENMGSITQLELEEFVATLVNHTDEQRAAAIVMWLISNNRENIRTELSAAYGVPITNYEPPAV